MTRVFVYGTLKRGASNHHELAGQHFVSEARTVAGFRLIDIGGYPGLVPWPADEEGVMGELWEIDAPALARLDRFEGTDTGLYVREPVSLQLPQGVQAEAYTFPGKIDGLRVIGSSWQE